MKLPASVTKYTKVFKALRYGEEAKPVRDWLVLLVLVVLLLVGSIIWNIIFFLSTVSDKERAVEVTENVEVDTSAVERVYEAFDARSQEEARYISEYQFIDPSR
jgi:ABC-type Na+ efflux pump permease subunit